MSDVRLFAGELRVDVPDTDGSEPRHLDAVEQVTRLALEIAPLLRRPADIPRRLADNAARDSLPSVRLRNLITLARGQPDHVVTSSALKRGARDRDPEVRLRAGIELGSRGLSTLEALAADPRVEDACSVRAVEALRASLTAARAEELLGAAVGQLAAVAQRPLTACACIDVLGERGEASIPALSRALWLEGPVGTAAVNALERIGSATVESAFVPALAISNEERTVAIARALGAVGSVAAVAPLMEAARRGGELKSAARQAIAEIQARTRGTPGQLSLAEGDEGRLSLVDEQAGQVSLAEPPGDELNEQGRRTKS